MVHGGAVKGSLILVQQQTSVLFEDLLVKALEVVGLLVQELDFLLASVAIVLVPSAIAALLSLNFRIQLGYPVPLRLLPSLQLIDSLLQVSPALLGLQLLPHRECHGAVTRDL